MFYIANWKSNKTLQETTEWIKQVGPLCSTIQHQVVLCPPFPYVQTAQEFIRQQKYTLSLGVQDVSPFPNGAYTGAVSADIVKQFSVQYAIVGHSERRTYFHETYQDVANKVTQACEAQITPIVCVEKASIVAQSAAIEPQYLSKCLIAFEPADHIGTGEPDSVEDVVDAHQRIQDAFGTVPFLYGGSVSPSTIQPFLEQSCVDGFLVGGASLDAHQFIELLKK